MRLNQLGSSDLFISEIGLGCMSLGTEERKAIGIVHEALDQGVNFLDTADIYDYGRNEELVGKAIKGKRDRVVLASKAGNRRIEGREGLVWDPSKAYIKSAIKESLRRLQTDYLDLYQLHGGTIEDPIDETIEAFEELKQEGLIRYYGISSIRPNVIRQFAARSSMVSVMNQYSILDRRSEEEVLPLLHEKGISVIARGPLASGALAAEREITKGYLNYTPEEIVELRTKLSTVAQECNRTMTELAIRYSLSHPAVATVIPGASSREQLLANIAAANTPHLTQEEIAVIRQISQANRYEQHR
ncbi:aldo/keto reductase [Paenibacillus sp. D2_2]|uniref:aldo/keto reductase n=1 Tax=Paenibacillus sp. D2_2 TaxID=3073092 RepID=UPI0028164870|nr:aldo/keto reductase [Paenibacillus sp. D2_2]WMT42124.1 aldo/keto reductase [Paenibacillus sp. D2_2]